MSWCIFRKRWGDRSRPGLSEGDDLDGAARPASGVDGGVVGENELLRVVDRHAFDVGLAGVCEHDVQVTHRVAEAAAWGVDGVGAVEALLGGGAFGGLAGLDDVERVARSKHLAGSGVGDHPRCLDGARALIGVGEAVREGCGDVHLGSSLCGGALPRLVSPL
jgi:hypothetical protein